MIKPESLKKGDLIGLIAPSGVVDIERVEKSIEVMKSLGFKVKVGDSCYSKHGYLAGEDKIRGNDINLMFADKDVKGIFAIRGGYGAARLLDNIDFKVIRNNPKLFIGYSDITALHIAINQRCKLITFHGPMIATEIIKGIDDYTKKWYENSIFSNKPLGIIAKSEEDLKVLVPGKVRGILTGGNLSLLVASIGTKYEIDTKGKILFIEEIEESPYKIDRMLLQLHQAGKFKDAKGIVFGAFTKCIASDESKSLTLEQVISEIVIPNNKPTVCNIKCGHCLPTLTLPMGAQVLLDANKGIIEILE